MSGGPPLMHSPEPGRSHDQGQVGTPGLLSLGDPRTGEALVASRIALVHRQQSLVAGHQRPCGGQNGRCGRSLAARVYPGGYTLTAGPVQRQPLQPCRRLVQAGLVVVPVLVPRPVQDQQPDNRRGVSVCLKLTFTCPDCPAMLFGPR